MITLDILSIIMKNIICFTLITVALAGYKSDDYLEKCATGSKRDPL